MFRAARHAFPLATLFTCIAAGAGATYAQSGTPEPLEIRIPQTPTVVPIGDQAMLVYELRVWNLSADTAVLDEIKVVDATRGTRILSLGAGDLLARLVHVSVGSQPSVAPGEQAVIFLEVPVGDDTVSALRHRIAFHVNRPDGPRRDEIATKPIEVDRRPIPVLGPPLRGGPWVAVYDPGLARGHRRVYYSVDGVARLPGRFAVDWMLAPGEGRNTGSGADVLAVADGTVVGLRDGIAEPVAGAQRAPVPSIDAGGNYVAVAVGSGKVAFYEHLQPGLRVSMGTRVRQGQVLAHLGMTGQAARPHLHFHLADAASPLGAEGQPYCLRGGRVIGRYRSIQAFGEGKDWEAAASTRTKTSIPSFPSPNDVVNFPE